MNTLCACTDQTALSTEGVCSNQDSSMRRATPETLMTWMPSLVIKAVQALTHYVSRKYNQRLDRQAFNYLLTLDENLLRDIGVTKQDILWASQLPLEVDAAARIEEIAKRR